MPEPAAGDDRAWRAFAVCLRFAPMNQPKVITHQPADYDRDFHAWSVEQAARLRESRPPTVDWENVAEEIESLGKMGSAQSRERPQQDPGALDQVAIPTGKAKNRLARLPSRTTAIALPVFSLTAPASSDSRGRCWPRNTGRPAPPRSRIQGFPRIASLSAAPSRPKRYSTRGFGLPPMPADPQRRGASPAGRGCWRGPRRRAAQDPQGRCCR